MYSDSSKHHRLGRAVSSRLPYSLRRRPLPPGIQALLRLRTDVIQRRLPACLQPPSSCIAKEPPLRMNPAYLMRPFRPHPAPGILPTYQGQPKSSGAAALDPGYWPVATDTLVFVLKT